MVSKLLKPQVSIFADSDDLLFLLLNPLPTAIRRLSFFIKEDAKEYC